MLSTFYGQWTHTYETTKHPNMNYVLVYVAVYVHKPLFFWDLKTWSPHAKTKFWVKQFILQDVEGNDEHKHKGYYRSLNLCRREPGCCQQSSIKTCEHAPRFHIHKKYIS